jgi:hypothetical protein
MTLERRLRAIRRNMKPGSYPVATEVWLYPRGAITVMRSHIVIPPRPGDEGEDEPEEFIPFRKEVKAKRQPPGIG